MNKRLEELSDMVRRGVPIDIEDAFIVIDYQTRLQNERIKKWDKSFLGRFVNKSQGWLLKQKQNKTGDKSI